MNYEEFKQEVTERIKEFLPEKYADADVSIQTVVKNNDLKLDGLMVRLEDSNIAPNIYLNQYFEQYEDGRDMDDILAAIADVRTEHEVDHDFDISKLTDFESVKDRISCKLINAEQNAEYLADKPYTMVDDLAVTYHIAIGKEESGTMSAPITNRLMEGYGVTVEQLHKLALDNMDTLTPASFKSMMETMADMMLPDMMRGGMTEEEAREAIAQMMPPTPEEKLYVLTNEDKLNGAAIVLNDKVMDDITEKLGQDFYILPSSVHEVLVVPKDPNVDLSTLESMVQEVNATQVRPEERLSDHVYAYDTKEHELFRADKAEERAAAKEAAVSTEKGAEKDSAKSGQKQERPSLKARLADKKDMIAKADKSKSHQMSQNKEAALA